MTGYLRDDAEQMAPLWFVPSKWMKRKALQSHSKKNIEKKSLERAAFHFYIFIASPITYLPALGRTMLCSMICRCSSLSNYSQQDILNGHQQTRVSNTGRKLHAIQATHSQYVHLCRNKHLICPRLTYKYRCINSICGIIASLFDLVNTEPKTLAAVWTSWPSFIINGRPNKSDFIGHLKNIQRWFCLLDLKKWAHINTS